ncbi:MAG TPA: hypothetical protein VHA73_10615 [Acidimicrobiales bacterium]|nr:hypothetical protein [Acidimicrobiales bacterium]
MHARDLSEPTILFIAGLYAVVGLAATLAYDRSVGGLGASISNRRTVINATAAQAGIQSYGHWEFLAKAGAIGAILLFAYWLQTRPRIGMMRGMILGALFLNGFGINLITTTRADLVDVGAAVVVVIVLIRGRLRTTTVLAVLFVGILGIGFLTAQRKGTADSNPGVLYGLDSALLNRNAYDLSKTLKIIDAVPSTLPYEYGKTIAALVIAPIPRAIWPNKPVITPGPIIGQRLYNLGRSGVPPGISGELVWNFGVPAAVILSILVGYLLGRSERRWYPRDPTDLTSLVFYSLVILTLAKAVVGVSVGQALTEALQTWVLLVPLYLLGRRARALERRRQRAGGARTRAPHREPPALRPAPSGPAATPEGVTLEPVMFRGRPHRPAGAARRPRLEPQVRVLPHEPDAIPDEIVAPIASFDDFTTGPPPELGLSRQQPSRRARGVRMLRGAGVRAAGAIVDQALSSLQNFVVLFAALHYLSVGGIGEFTLAYTISLLALSTVRSLVLEPITIRFSAAGDRDRRSATASASGASLLLGLLTTALALLAFPLLPRHAALIVLAAAAIMPLLLVQDAWRFHLFASGRAWAAAANDGICLIATGLVTLAVVHHGHPTVPVLMIVWGVGTGAGLIAGIVQIGVLPGARSAWRWLTSHKDLGLRLAGETLAQQAAGRLSLIMLSGIVSVGALGELSASRTLMTPLTTLIAATIAFAVPEAVRLRARSGRQLDLYVTGLSIALVATVVVFTAGLYFLPARLGHLLAGKNWGISKKLLIPTALWAAGMGANQGPRVGLRAVQQPKLILRVASFLGVCLLVGTTIGAVTAGAEGAAWGFGLVSAFGQVPWQIAYRRANPRARRASETDS